MISLGTGWMMKADKDCITIYRKIVHKETGKIYNRPTFYYSTYGTALEGLLDRHIQTLDTDNLRTIALEIGKAKESIIKQLKEMKLT